MKTANSNILSFIARPNADSIGAAASFLCLVHCVVTPFIFVAQVCTASCCETAPDWWKWVDYFFLVVSFFAVYRSAATTSRYWMKLALWISWEALFLMILNEHFGWATLPSWAIYIPALALVFLHLYNWKYCRCEEDTCCTD